MLRTLGVPIAEVSKKKRITKESVLEAVSNWTVKKKEYPSTYAILTEHGIDISGCQGDFTQWAPDAHSGYSRIRTIAIKLEKEGKLAEFKYGRLILYKMP